MEVRVVPYDSNWPAEFAAEADRIRAALGGMAVALHHIGSTAVPGLWAKPVIDILLEVDDLAALDARPPALVALGYESMGEFGIPGRRYFRRNTPAGVRTHQIHAFVRGSSGGGRHLAFRDYLLAHPEVAGAYGRLKQRLAAAHPEDLEAYMDGKDAFIKEHEARALRWARRQRTEFGQFPN